MINTTKTQLTKNDFYMVYSKNLADYLTRKGFEKIVVAINPVNSKMYSLFHHTPQLSQEIERYRNRNK